MLGYYTLLSKTIEIIILKVFWLLDTFGKDIDLSIKIHNSMDVQVTACLTENQVYHSLQFKISEFREALSPADTWSQIKF